MPKQKIFRIFITMMILGFSSSIFAQLRINSPYSSFGLGDLSTNSGGYYSSMGNMKYSLLSDHHINDANAASYIGIDSGSFLFDVGFRGSFVNTMTANASSTSNYANLDYIKMAFPVTGWWRSSLGLMPYSTTGYQATSSQNIDSIGDVFYSYLGDGGTNKVYFGNAFKINNNISVGFNASYIFGGINSTRSDSFPDINYGYDYKIINSNHISGLYMDFGVQYRKTFTRKNSALEGKTFSFGATISPQQKLTYNTSSFAYTFSSTNANIEYVKDTVKNANGTEGKITMPLFVGTGVSFGKKDKWLVGVDGSYAMWENYKLGTISDSLTNSLSLNVGGEYYIKNLALRMGARYDQGNINIKGNAISDLGISFGVGIPLRKYKKSRTSSISSLDIGIEVGQRGTTDAGLIKQQYMKVYMSLGIQNTWFQKIKYQ